MYYKIFTGGYYRRENRDAIGLNIIFVVLFAAKKKCPDSHTITRK